MRAKELGYGSAQSLIQNLVSCQGWTGVKAE